MRPNGCTRKAVQGISLRTWARVSALRRSQPRSCALDKARGREITARNGKAVGRSISEAALGEEEVANCDSVGVQVALHRYIAGS